MPSTYRPIAKQVTRITRSGTQMLRVTAVNGPRRPELPPVILLHGWPFSLTPSFLMDLWLRKPQAPFDQDAYAIDALLATGRTVYRPFTGSNWGTASTTWPSVGGTGTNAINHCMDQAADDGITATVVDLWGTSMGACNALNWAWRNPDNVRGVFLSNPGFDLSYLYDQDATTVGWGLGEVSVSLRTVHGGANKTEWLPLSEDYDPYRNTTEIEPIAQRIAIFSSRDDEVVPWVQLEAWCESLGIPLTASAPEGSPGGGHLAAPFYSGWNDFLPMAWFDTLPIETPAPPPPPPPPVVTAPGAPTGVTAVAAAGSASVSWNAPSLDGGAAVTGYRITPYIGATAQTPVVHASTATTRVVTGLTNGTAYTFKVAATNAIGTGTDSVASSSVTPITTPSAPEIVDLVVGDEEVLLGWTAPTSTGGTAITGYRITPYIGATAQTPINTGSTALTHAVTGLTNGTTYTFRVAATNSVGTGPQSAASAPATPSAPLAPDPLDPVVYAGYERDWLMEFDTANWTLKNAADVVTNSNAKALWSLVYNARQGGTQSHSLAANVETDTVEGLMRLKADDVDTGTGTSLRAYSSAYMRNVTAWFQPLEGRYELMVRFPLGHSVWPALWFNAYGAASRFEVDWPELFTADTPGRGSLSFHSGDDSSGSYGGPNLMGKAWMGNAWTWHIPSAGRKFTGPFAGSTRYGKAVDIADPSDPENVPWTKVGFEIERVFNTAGTRYTIRMKFYLDEQHVMTYLDPFNPETGVGPAGTNATGWSGNYPKWVHDSFVAGATLTRFWDIRIWNLVGSNYVGRSVTNPSTPSAYGSRVYDYTGTFDNGQTGYTPAGEVPDASADRWPFYLDVKWLQRLAKT